MPDGTTPSAIGAPLRKRWMSAFARTDADHLQKLFDDVGAEMHFDILRPAESGSVMVRGRAGGTGQLFNVGEMTVTRCTVRSGESVVGHGYIAGRDRKHAEVAACLDALFQGLEPTQAETIVQSLEQEIVTKASARQQASAPTRVEFFTMVRGENE